VTTERLPRRKKKKGTHPLPVSRYRDQGFFFFGKEVKRWMSENTIRVGRPKKEAISDDD